MRPSTLLRTLSFRIPARLSPSPVAPWPVRSAIDRWLGAELDNLQPHDHHQPHNYTTTTWLLQALDVAITTQKKTMDLIATNNSQSGLDSKRVDDYLEDMLELLDACNNIRERIDSVRKYTESLAVALHCLGAGRGPNESALARARVALGSCESMERSCTELDRCNSKLRKLGEKLAQGVTLGPCTSELDEALSASKAVALLVCGMLSIFLSFKTRRGLPVTQSPKTGSWSSSLHELNKLVKEEVEKQKKSGGPVLEELRSTVVMVRDLRSLIQQQGNEMCWRELRVIVEGLGRRSEELEEGIKMFEGRVNEIYRYLICIRMALLGVLTTVV